MLCVDEWAGVWISANSRCRCSVSTTVSQPPLNTRAPGAAPANPMDATPVSKHPDRPPSPPPPPPRARLVQLRLERADAPLEGRPHRGDVEDLVHVHLWGAGRRFCSFLVFLCLCKSFVFCVCFVCFVCCVCCVVFFVLCVFCVFCVCARGVKGTRRARRAPRTSHAPSSSSRRRWGKASISGMRKKQLNLSSQLWMR